MIFNLYDLKKNKLGLLLTEKASFVFYSEPEFSANQFCLSKIH